MRYGGEPEREVQRFGSLDQSDPARRKTGASASDGVSLKNWKRFLVTRKARVAKRHRPALHDASFAGCGRRQTRVGLLRFDIDPMRFFSSFGFNYFDNQTIVLRILFCLFVSMPNISSFLRVGFFFFLLFS